MNTISVAEFHAWLDGFQEALQDKPPSAKQWAKIQEKLKLIRPDKNTHYVYQPWLNQIGWNYSVQPAYSSLRGGQLTTASMFDKAYLGADGTYYTTNGSAGDNTIAANPKDDWESLNYDQGKKDATE